MERILILSTLILLHAATSPSFTFSQSSTSNEKARLAQSIDALLNEDTYENAIWGVQIIDLDSGETLYERNARKSLMPASNVKLYTTAAALDLLGPSFRYETPIYTDGPMVQGVLKGNLIVRGSGDPSIGGRYDEGDPTQALRAIANTLKNGGLQRIEGDIIGDDDLFDDLPLGLGWSWDDEPYYFSAEINALSFYDNSVQFILEGQRPGMPASVRWNPFNTSYIDVNNQTITLHPDSSRDNEYVRLRNFNTVDVLTQIPANRIDTTYISVSNPAAYFSHTLRTVLIQEGISVKGRAIDIDELSIKPRYDQRRYRQRTVYTSPPLDQIIEVLNKESQNLYAELLIRTLGVHNPPLNNDPDLTSAEKGIEAAMASFARAKIDTSRIQLVDGSGLSRMNYVTPEMTAQLLTYMWNHPYATVRQAFYNSLPVGGVDGTLEDRMRSGASYRNVRAKTGTLTGASSLSGYVTSKTGSTLLFVLMCNNYTVKTKFVRRTQDAIVGYLSQYSE